MFNVGGGEILVIMLLALLVLGPDKLPEYARKAGRYMNEFRRMTSGFQEEFRQAIDLGADGSATPADDDAVHRTTEGPRLAPRPETPDAPGSAEAPADPAGAAPPAEPTAATEPSAAVEPEPAPTPVPTPPVAPTPTYGGAFAADATPAPGTGPELITPGRPAAEADDETGSTSAA